MTHLQRRLKRLEAILMDSTGLVSGSEKWLEYWQRWIDRWAADPDFRPKERMPIAAARAVVAGRLVLNDPSAAENTFR